MISKYTYLEAQQLIKDYDIASASDYLRLRSSNPDFKKILPAQPMVFYKTEWQGWEAFTGVGYKKVDLDIKELQRLASKLNLRTKEEWQLAIKRNELDAPAHINKIVGFKNWESLFKVETYLNFAELLLFARSLNLKGQTDWRIWCKGNKRPKGVPFNLRKHYFDHYLEACPDKKPSFWRYIFQGN